MGCMHHVNELQLDITTADDDSFNGTVMSPSIPNPNTTKTTAATTTTISSTALPPSPYYSFIHTNNLSPLNHHLAIGAANIESRTECIEQPLGSSRWNPTPEQLLALEEMYRCGIRTPSAEQIQQIATQLRRFGKIEGKNVFYWFQNHKARERQKRRREIESSSEEKHHETDSYLEKKESGLRKGTSYDVEQTRNWASSSNWSRHSEEFVSMHRSVSMAETGPHGWTQFDDRELQLQRKMISTNSRTVDNINGTNWQTQEYFPSPPNPTKLMPDLFKTKTSSDLKLLNNHQNLSSSISSSSSSSSLMIKPYQEDFSSVLADENDQKTTPTLELFPLRSDDHNSVEAAKKHTIKVHSPTINNTTFAPNQYIEFLPLKN